MRGTFLHRLWWRFFYALRLYERGELPWDIGWGCSADAYKDFGEDTGPTECADEELSCWSE